MINNFLMSKIQRNTGFIHPFVFLSVCLIIYGEYGYAKLTIPTCRLACHVLKDGCIDTSILHNT